MSNTEIGMMAIVKRIQSDGPKCRRFFDINERIG